MSKTIQIRDIPDRVHAILRSRAATAGESLSDFLRPELERVAGRPATADLLRRVRDRTEGPTVAQIVASVRAGRAGRER